jgi:hypothetical protein
MLLCSPIATRGFLVWSQAPCHEPGALTERRVEHVYLSLLDENNDPVLEYVRPPWLAESMKNVPRIKSDPT